MWICTQGSNDELRGDISRLPWTSKLYDLTFARDSSVAAHSNDFMMVDPWQNGAVSRLASFRGIFHQDSS